MFPVKIKLLKEGAKVPFKTYERDFCYDCVATSVEEVAPNTYKYGLGFALEMDVYDVESVFSIDIRPRSSIYKHGLILSNSTGTVDELYRGEISVIFYHINKDLPKYEVGDKVCQMKVGFTVPIDFEKVTKLTETPRGEGGFGSTGC